MADDRRTRDGKELNLYQLLIDSVIDYAIYMLDPEGRIVSWNSGARRAKGYEPDEIIGQHYSKFFTPEDIEAERPDHALRVAAEEGRYESEGWRVRKDGSRFWANAVLDAIRDETGELIGFVKITRDITERREAEQALFESEQRFRLLVQGVRDYAIYMLDPDGRITNWNTGGEAIKGYTADEIVGQHFSRFYTEEDRASGEPARALATALEKGIYEREAWRVRKDGTRFWAHVVLDPLHDDEGRHIGFAKVTRDITERRQAREQLEAAREALFQSQKLQSLGELTGGIAHDFNNMMTVIRGSADMLRRGTLSPDKQHRYLDAILETAERASELTSHLLAFGRRQPLNPEVVDLNVRLDALGEILSRTLGGQVEVKLDLAPDLDRVEADASQLEAALLNAAINARDAMPGGGTLTITTRNCAEEAGDMVCVSLTDTGEGMPDHVLKRAFEPFFTTKPVGKGTGLGLSQIYGFAAQSGGRAEIESNPGQGTTVRLILPRSRKAAADEAEGAALIDKGNGEAVLLVEDNGHVRDFAGHLLEELGYRVIAAESADEALRLLESEKVDILFSDIVMPGRSGVELARIVKERWPDLPVLLTSGYSEEMVKGIEEDFDLLRKPYNQRELAAALARLSSPDSNEALRRTMVPGAVR